jgi:predicted lipoprotein
MQRSKTRLTLALAPLALVALVALVVTACSGAAPMPTASPIPATAIPPTVAPTKAPVAPTTAAQYTDAFAYCAAVGTLDKADARYTGANPPDLVLQGLRKAMNLGDAMPNDQLAKSTFWRCMGGKVYACNVGANIPCSAKAVTDKTPTQGMNDFCKANPKSDFLPAAVTGRETVYSWKCTDGVPAVDKELTKPDAAGFLSMFWYEIAGK